MSSHKFESCGDVLRPRLDNIEREYIAAIERARGSDEANDLAIGLKQYRDMFKVGWQDEW